MTNYYKKTLKRYNELNRKIGKLMVYKNNHNFDFKVLVFKRDFLYYKLQIIEYFEGKE